MLTWFIHILTINSPFWLCKYAYYTLKWSSLFCFSVSVFDWKYVDLYLPSCEALSSVSYSPCTQTQVFPKLLCLYKCPTMDCWQARLFCWTQIMCDSLTFSEVHTSLSRVWGEKNIQNELSNLMLFIMIIGNEYKILFCIPSKDRVKPQNPKHQVSGIAALL